MQQAHKGQWCSAPNTACQPLGHLLAGAPRDPIAHEVQVCLSAAAARLALQAAGRGTGGGMRSGLLDAPDKRHLTPPIRSRHREAKMYSGATARQLSQSLSLPWPLPTQSPMSNFVLQLHCTRRMKLPPAATPLTAPANRKGGQPLFPRGSRYSPLFSTWPSPRAAPSASREAVPG